MAIFAPDKRLPSSATLVSNFTQSFIVLKLLSRVKALPSVKFLGLVLGIGIRYRNLYNAHRLLRLKGAMKSLLRRHSSLPPGYPLSVKP